MFKDQILHTKAIRKIGNDFFSIKNRAIDRNRKILEIAFCLIFFIFNFFSNSRDRHSLLRRRNYFFCQLFWFRYLTSPSSSLFTVTKKLLRKKVILLYFSSEYLKTCAGLLCFGHFTCIYSLFFYFF